MSASIAYLQAGDLLAVNRALCQTRHRPFGLRDAAALKEALQRPSLCIDGYEPFPELWEKAAVLMDSLFKSRPFLSANIPSGFLAADLMLRLNGHVLRSIPEDKELITSVSLQQVTVLQIAEWLRGRATRGE